MSLKEKAIDKDLNDIIAKSGISIPSEQTVNIGNSKENADDSDNNTDIAEMNVLFSLRERIYEGVLSPQLEENEKLKRDHKDILMKNIFKILKYQFVFTYIFVLILLGSIIFSNFLVLDNTIIKSIIKFIEFYITSIVVELISILFFIVRSVFDKSIVSLFSNFDNLKKGK